MGVVLKLHSTSVASSKMSFSRLFSASFGQRARFAAGALAMTTGAVYQDSSQGYRAYTWGNGLGGRLGNSSENSSACPSAVEHLPGVSELLCSKEATLALTPQGELYSWGNGASGKLGHGNDMNQTSPALIQELVANDDVVVQMASGDSHTAVLCKSGKVYTWGMGRTGQTGHGKRGDVFLPKVVESLVDVPVSSVSCGAAHTLVISKSGDVFTCGYGFEGALGHGDKSNQMLLKQISLPEGVTAVQAACGRNYSLLLCSDGQVYSFGDDGYGQLGLGRSEKYVRSPNKVGYLSRKNIVKIFAGENHSAAISSTGELYLWGYNSSGQLGNGSTQDCVVPTKLDMPAAVSDVSCGGNHTLVQLQGGDVYVFGRGREGQLGIQATGESVAAYRNKPVKLPATQFKGKLIKVSAGGDHTGALVEE